MPYLLKTEPDKYSYDDLLRDGETTWDGISNNQALLTLRNMKKGDKLVIYHSNVGKAAVGTAKVVSVDATDPKNPNVRIQPVKRLKREKPLAEIREAPVFQGSILFRQFRLSVVPLSVLAFKSCPFLHTDAAQPFIPLQLKCPSTHPVPCLLWDSKVGHTCTFFRG
jgi:predicted RNA-binding protein with PUA-like domain